MNSRYVLKPVIKATEFQGLFHLWVSEEDSPTSCSPAVEPESGLEVQVPSQPLTLAGALPVVKEG